MNGFNFIVIPTKYGGGGGLIDPMHRANVLSYVVTTMVDELGGVTVEEKDGVWRNPEGNLVSEKVTVYSSYGHQAHPLMLALAKRVKEWLYQDSVMFGFTPSEVTFV